MKEKLYTGSQFKDIKLVDDIGGEQHAIDITAQLDEITGEYNVKLYPPIYTTNYYKQLTSTAAYSLDKGIGNFMQKGTIVYVSS